MSRYWSPNSQLSTHCSRILGFPDRRCLHLSGWRCLNPLSPVFDRNHWCQWGCLLSAIATIDYFLNLHAWFYGEPNTRLYCDGTVQIIWWTGSSPCCIVRYYTRGIRFHPQCFILEFMNSFRGILFDDEHHGPRSADHGEADYQHQQSVWTWIHTMHNGTHWVGLTLTSSWRFCWLCLTHLSSQKPKWNLCHICWKSRIRSHG